MWSINALNISLRKRYRIQAHHLQEPRKLLTLIRKRWWR